eukprot:Nitzschia sp. Nitz4//scaffold62_size106224//16353//18218//NITZ4_004343-RA/size106224-augustus-gene-0.99-mRNA-1//-1//CDS//3329555817//1762//frame0
MSNPDVEANEETKLVDKDSGDDSSPESSALWQETDQPWPASFERSISLLASPVVAASDAELFTKSPQPGNTPLAIRRRLRAETPRANLVAPIARLRSSNEDDINAEQSHHLDLETTKDNLRASARLVPLADGQKIQEKKAKEAAEYRAKILKQTGSDATKLSKKAKDHQKSLEGKATSAECAFNLANILMGVGLLGLPYACSKAGVLGGTFALMVLGLICWKTSILIGRELNGDPRPSSYFDDSPWKTPLPPGSVPQARMRKPISSFPDIARQAFGNKGAVFLAIVLYFELFSCVCIFLVSIGSHLHTLFPNVSMATHMIGCCIVSAIPIVVLRTAKLLSYLSMVGTIATVCVVGAVVLAYLFEGDISENVAARTPDPPEPPYHELWKPDGLAVAFGLVAYCFSGHAIIPNIYSSMKKPQEFESVVTASFVVVLLCCLAVGLSGYAMFGTLVYDQVTISLEQNSSAALAMTILTYLMVLTAFSKLVLTMFPLSIGMEELAAPYLSSEQSSLVVSSVIKVVLLVLALLVAIYVPSFSLLCSLVGMICTMTVSVIFPAAAYLKLFGHKLGFWEKLAYYLFVIAGILVAVIGTVFGL